MSDRNVEHSYSEVCLLKAVHNNSSQPLSNNSNYQRYIDCW